MAAHTRNTDVIGRWGGEEFLIVCSQTSASQLILLAEKLRTLVAKTVFEPNNPLQVTISLGIAAAKPKESFEHLYKRIDTALYKAKNTGRNCYMFAEQ